MSRSTPTCWRCVSERDGEKPRAARYSKMFCTQRCAASWSVDLLETSIDYEWCRVCEGWRERGEGCDHADRIPVWDIKRGAV